MSDSAGNSGGKKPRGKPFPKGTSGNPTGRPKGAAGLAKFLRIQTRNGRVGARNLMNIAAGTVTRPRHLVTKDGIVVVKEPPSFTESIAAEKVILARMHGSEQKFLEVTGKDGGPLALALDKLEHVSEDDLEALEGIIQRALFGTGDAGGSEGGEGEAG